MVVFVCSPYGGKKKNLDAAREYCRIEIDNGNTPFAPHLLYTQLLDEKTDRWLGIQLGLEMLERVDALHVWGDEITEGMQMEIDFAIDNGIPVVQMGRCDADS
jgi:hypothetical protein